MWEALFGTDLPLPVKFIVAFVLVLALIIGAAYLVRRFGATALNAAVAARGRQPRLAVIDAASVDGRRRLVLIRRDNVEHLIMIGGPSDVVIEPNIVRAIPTSPAREMAPARMSSGITDTLPRAVPLAEGGMWPLQPEPPPRPQRASPPPPPPPPVREEEEDEQQEAEWSAPPEPALPEPPPRAAPERAPRMQNTDRLAGLAVDLSRNFVEPDAAPPPRRAAEPRRTAPAPVQLPDTEEQNLAEMAHRLESALHRPRQAGEPAPVSAPPPARAAEQPRAEPQLAVRAEPKPAPKAAAKPGAKPGFDSLEQEMASLLGRPGKT